MTAKRALVVDDSRSARVILSRMLETHGLHVDTAESGEQALDYLREAHPDVVFMDHLMPGMDGFDAVKAIKRDARTATIPVMMYTSQEGDDYLREARAIGAVGVLSKTLLQTDVSRALYQLKLLPERRDREVSRSAPQSFVQHAPHSILQPLPQPIATTTFAPRENLADLKRSLEASMEHAARRISNEIRSAIQVPQPNETAPSRPATPRGLIAALLLFSLLPTLVCGALLWRSFALGKARLDQANARLGIVVAEQQTQIETLRAELRNRTSGEATEFPSTRTEVLPIAYGEPPFAGGRVELIRKVFEQLQADGFKGQVRVGYFTGDFCLTRNVNGYALAKAELPQRRCDLIGNPFDDALTATQRQSSELTALVNFVTQGGRGAIQATIADGGRKPSVAYPSQSDTLTAGAWNQVAERNNRIEIATAPGNP